MDPSAKHVAWSASVYEMFHMEPNSHVNLFTSSINPAWTQYFSISSMYFRSIRSWIFFHYKTTFASALPQRHVYKLQTSIGPDNVNLCSISEIHCKSMRRFAEQTGSGTRELEGKSTSRPCTNVASQLLERIQHCTVNVGGTQDISLEFNECNMQNHEFQMLSLLRVI